MDSFISKRGKKTYCQDDLYDKSHLLNKKESRKTYKVKEIGL